MTLMKTNESNLKKQADKTFVLKLTIASKDVKNEYSNQLKSVQANFENKGFRKGKAPLEVVEQSISQEKLFEEVASRLISNAYAEEIKKNDLKPIIQPQVKFLGNPSSFEADWEIEITGCEMPDLKLNDKYKEDIKKANTSNKDKKDEQNIDKLVDVLIKNSQIKLPQILINSDLDNQMHQLAHQAAHENQTAEEYLKSQNKTLKDYQTEIEKQLIKEWTLNLAITKISQDEKIEIDQKEVQQILSSNPAMAENINLLYYILTQQKVFDFLKNLK